MPGGNRPENARRPGKARNDEPQRSGRPIADEIRQREMDPFPAQAEHRPGPDPGGGGPIPGQVAGIRAGPANAQLACGVFPGATWPWPGMVTV